MVPEEGDRYVVYVVPAADARPEPAFRRYRMVAGGLLCAVALMALASASGTVGRRAALAAAPLGSQAAAMEQRELQALASIKDPNSPPHVKQLLVVGPAKPTALAWLNAGAAPDANVFAHPATWTAPDDPLRPTPSPVTSAEYAANIHPAGGLEVVHSTDNGSPVGDSFAWSRTADDLFHGSAPSPPPPPPTSYFTMPKGNTVTIVAPTENGQSGDYKEFDFDTTADDFFTHHPPAKR